MKAYTYVKPGLAQFLDVEKPVVRKPTDAIVRMDKSTIHDVTLHIMKSDVLVFVPIMFLLSDSEQNSFVRQRIHI